MVQTELRIDQKYSMFEVERVKFIALEEEII